MQFLSPRDIAMLSDLDPVAGTPVKMIAHHMVGPTARHRSGLATYELNSLWRKGYVARLDDKKPVCWIITEKGLATLEKESQP